MAPEVILGNGYTFTADYYSLGVLAYELIYGNPPFYRKKAGEDIFIQVIKETPVYSKQVSEEMQDFMNKLLVKNPTQRLGANGYQEIMLHPWLAGIDFSKVSRRELPSTIDLIPALSELKYKKAHQMLTQGGDMEDEQIFRDLNQFRFTYDTENDKDFQNLTCHKEVIMRFSAFSELKPDFGRTSRNFGLFLTSESTNRFSLDMSHSLSRPLETTFSEKKDTGIFKRAKFAALGALKNAIKRSRLFDQEGQDEDVEIPNDGESLARLAKSYRLTTKLSLQHF
mgnify:FL=1